MYIKGKLLYSYRSRNRWIDHEQKETFSYNQCGNRLYTHCFRDPGHGCFRFTKEAQAWQEARSQAFEKIASIDREFYEAYENGTFSELLQEDYGFSIPFEEGKELQVTLVPVLPEENQGRLYRITSFKEVNTEEWEGSSSLNLLDPAELTQN